MTRYVVTGTTGNLGSRVLRSMLAQGEIPASDIIVSSSNPAFARIGMSDLGVELRQGDYRDRSSLRAAFDGADVLFLMSHPDPGIRRVEYHKNAIEVAREVGIKTVVYSSMMLGGETGMDSQIGIQQGHIHTMRYLAEAGIDHIVVRQGIYAEAWGHYAGMFRSIGPRKLEWVLPHDIAVAWTALDELGEGNARILAHYEDYVNQTLRLTGPEATKISDIARIVEKRTGLEIEVRVVGSRGNDGWYEPLSKGEGEVVDPLLGELLGRAPKSLRDMPDDLFRVI